MIDVNDLKYYEFLEKVIELFLVKKSQRSMVHLVLLQYDNDEIL